MTENHDAKLTVRLTAYDMTRLNRAAKTLDTRLATLARALILDALHSLETAGYTLRQKESTHYDRHNR